MLAALDVASLEKVAARLTELYRADGTLYVIGNGGSASTASHMGCDLSKGTSALGKRRLRVVSLTDNVGWMTAISNDISYEQVFTEQLRNLLRPNDVVLGISASGNSPNLVKAFDFAKEQGVSTIAFVGFKGGKMKEIADLSIHMQSADYGPVEDGHLVLNHILVEHLRALIASEGAALAL